VPPRFHAPVADICNNPDPVLRSVLTTVCTNPLACSRRTNEGGVFARYKSLRSERLRDRLSDARAAGRPSMGGTRCGCCARAASAARPASARCPSSRWAAWTTTGTRCGPRQRAGFNVSACVRRVQHGAFGNNVARRARVIHVMNAAFGTSVSRGCDMCDIQGLAAPLSVLHHAICKHCAGGRHFDNM